MKIKFVFIFALFLSLVIPFSESFSGQMDYECLNNCIKSGASKPLCEMSCTNNNTSLDSTNSFTNGNGSAEYYKCFRNCTEATGNDDMNKVVCDASCK
jgi:hypothetical protein